MLGEKDVLKVDFGVHVKGRILDSAFTLNFDPTYDKLLEAVKAATDTGVRVSIFRVRTEEGPQALTVTIMRLWEPRKQASTCGWASWLAISRKPWSHMRSRSTARCCQVSRGARKDHIAPEPHSSRHADSQADREP